MKKSGKVYLFSILLSVLLLTVSSLVGCKGTPAPTPTPAPAPASTLTPTPVPKPSGPPYYQGKTITIISPSAPGGGVDLFPRWLSLWLTRFIPGNPTVVVRNMPGAAMMVGANYAYKVAKPDGLTIFTSGGGAQLNYLLQAKGVEYDFSKMSVVLAQQSSNFMWMKAGLIQKFEDLYEKDILIVGATAAPGASFCAPLLAKELLGIKIKRFISAYGSVGDARVAFLAGELNCVATSSVVSYMAVEKEMEKRGEIMPLFQTGMFDAQGNNVRYEPEWSHIPTLQDLYVKKYGQPPSGPVWEGYKLMVLSGVFFDKGQWFPPKTPPEIVKIVADAIESMIKDPEFKSQYDKAQVVPLVVGEALQKSYRRAFVDVDPKASEWLKNWLAPYGVQ